MAEDWKISEFCPISGGMLNKFDELAAQKLSIGATASLAKAWKYPMSQTFEMTLRQRYDG
jgi:hypothetical protein